MIQTNQMEIAFDFEAIARDFTIFEAKRDQGNYWKSGVPDIALQECRALAVVYEWGPSCYILYHRTSVEQYSLKQALECCEDNVRVQEITAQKLAETKKHLLAQLLCNALPGIQANGELYHNVTGKLYYMQPNWFYYRKEVLASFWTLQISFAKDCCVKLDVKTFSNVRIKQDSKNKPQYLFDPECYILRRALRDDPGKSTDHFVIGALNQRRRNTVPFLEFGSLTDYQNCKVGILHQFLRDVQTSLSPYLSLTIELRHILNLKSNLGKQINRFIFEESGVLIGNALKSARNKEALFGGVLGIRHFCKDDAQYYYSGYLGKSINRSFPHACRIRKVCSTGQTLQFQRYLPLLEVDFIRANGWTVIPFPFKYLREWRLQQG